MEFYNSIKTFLKEYAALIIFSISILIIVASTVRRFIKRMKRARKRKIVKTYSAKIMSKRIFEPDTSNKNEGLCYYFDFVLENGERVEFPVNHEIYESTEEGTTGVLVFKGGKCISFDFDK